MNYKNMLVALAATVTLGVTPALSSVNANAASTTKTTTSTKTPKKTPKASSSYWTKNQAYVSIVKDTKVNKASIKTVNKQNTLVMSKSTKTLKKGTKIYARKNNGAWILYTINSKNKVSYYVTTNSKLVNSTSWLKLVPTTTDNTTNNSSNNNNTTSNKKVVTVKGAYKTADTDYYQGTDYGTAFFSPDSKAYSANGATLNPGDKAQVKVVTTGSSASYQLELGGQTVTVPQSDTFKFTNINVFPSQSSSSSSSTSYPVYVSTYSPDSSDAVVSKSFKLQNGTRWVTIDSLSSSSPKTIHIYIYNSSTSSWDQTSINSSNQLVYDYQ
ncbi:hypothetical protein [Lactobacillus sp. Sy-1]|uniref:hypothetical protein n=1 Tax=Lactobacillus sp. Sy-1 TaxID=2109645 RepID=UPI001C57D8D8|nr:hypothetical protein [Lactobacillus sp. Sy-1]MBW1605079.1 hypothetical protein [Lactobacillus sp. Sy-1]